MILKFNVITEPVFLLVIEDFFSDEINKSILNEVISNKKHFKDATVSSQNIKKEKFRNNKSAEYDIIYNQRRNDSVLLRALSDFFMQGATHDLLSSCEYPINMFNNTNFDETQVSRYGDSGQKYDWHVDTYGINRQITLCYYFHKEPKKYKGGEIEFCKSPIYKGKLIDNNRDNIITITPKNNMAVIFSGYVAHRVKNTISPKKFNDGRFSVNCWIGRSN